MSYLLSLASKLKPKAPIPAPAPAPAPVVQTPVVESFLSVSESVVPVPQSTSLVEETVPVVEELLVIEAVYEEPTEAPSEEQCASPQVPASTASSHTEESC
jgi:hypothetical protein